MHQNQTLVEVPHVIHFRTQINEWLHVTLHIFCISHFVASGCQIIKFNKLQMPFLSTIHSHSTSKKKFILTFTYTSCLKMKSYCRHAYECNTSKCQFELQTSCKHFPVYIPVSACLENLPYKLAFLLHGNFL